LGEVQANNSKNQMEKKLISYSIFKSGLKATRKKYKLKRNRLANYLINIQSKVRKSKYGLKEKKEEPDSYKI